MPAVNGGDDFVGISGPNEGLWLFVVLNEGTVDGGLKIDNGMETASFQTPLRQPGEETLYRVEP